MSSRMTTAQRIAMGMLLAGFLLLAAATAAVMWQYSQLVPYTNAPPPDSTLYLWMLRFGGVLVAGAMAIVSYQAWRTKGLAGMWDAIAPKTGIQKFGFGLAMAGFIMAMSNFIQHDYPFGTIVMVVGMSLWQWSSATKKDPANS